MKHSYFSEDEIQCKCGCGLIIVKSPHFFRMNLLRQAMKQPLKVNSWCRCLHHNIAVGGSNTSSHLEGWATDIEALTNLFKIKLIFYAGVIGFNGIGVGDTFVHLDTDPVKGPDRFWIY